MESESDLVDRIGAYFLWRGQLTVAQHHEVATALRSLGALTVLVAVGCGSEDARRGMTPPIDAGGAAGSPASENSTASGGSVAGGAGGSPGADGFAIEWELASDILSTAPTTVAIVTWTLDKPDLTEAHIDFGLDTTYGMTAPVDLTEVDNRTVLVGMKPARTYHFQIVATDGSQTYTSSDLTLTTGAPTTLIPPPIVTISEPDEVDAGFIIGSFWIGVNGQDSSTVFIIDTDGDVVWWYTDTAIDGASELNDGIGRARLSADSHDVWLVDAQRPVPLRRVSLDTLDVQDYQATGGTHDICAVSGDTMAYLDTKATTCASIVEIDKSGTTKVVFDSTAVTGSQCHGNAIRYSQKQDAYVFSDRDTDVYVLDRAGTVAWKLSDKVSGGHATWGGVQHGVQLLDASLLLFANEPTGGGDWQDSQAMEFGLDGSVIKRFTSRGATDWMGDVQRLPSGNTLINYASGPVEEVDPDDNVVLEIDLGAAGYTEFRQSLYGPPLDIEE